MRVASVAKDGGIWRWECRRCGVSDTRWQHREAIREVREHLARHATFGFRSESASSRTDKGRR